MDFMHNMLANGQKIRIFILVDVHTRECLTLVAQPRFRGEDVAQILTTADEQRGGLPSVIQVDKRDRIYVTRLGPLGLLELQPLSCPHRSLAFDTPAQFAASTSGGAFLPNPRRLRN